MTKDLIAEGYYNKLKNKYFGLLCEREKGRDWCRAWRQGADPDDGEGPDAESALRWRGPGRCAGRRDLPCASSTGDQPRPCGREGMSVLDLF